MFLNYLLRAARKNSGLTLREAASFAGIAPSTLYRYEEGEIRSVPEKTAELLLRLYDKNYAGGRGPGQDAYTADQSVPQIKEESRTEISSDFLYKNYLAADERGRETILYVLLQQSCRGSAVNPSE